MPLTVNINRGGYSGPVTLALTRLPSGITAPVATVTNQDSCTIQVSASLSADQEDFPPNLIQPASHATSALLVATAGGIVNTETLTLTVSLSNPSYVPAASDINLPILRIDTGGQAVVSKDIDVPTTITVTSADGQTSYLPNASDSDNTA